ncbi:MAG: energy transducer TonB [Brevundimonas sp.]|uniref:energy transducer TonB n=1 Tax=Brevundimonas sp. TaxID=1871086 RepID=UPI0025B911A4|nr:TonB family protein [Brevundimonas sp.]MCH4269279.1 energy transducer TonB [Brevundimonas sp.]
MRPTRMKQWRWGAGGLVVLLHLGAFVLLGVGRPEPPLVTALPPILVDLVPPPPIPPPPPPHSAPAASQGGGAPAAPSVVRPPPPRPAPRRPEIVAPARPAPEQPLIIGVAPEPGPTPGPGQGGQGTGSGGGGGSGVGPGVGDGPPRIIRGPTVGELRTLHPREAFRRRMGGRATLACRVRLDTTLSDCRLVDETPPGMGFGEAALAAARYFRFRPPTQNGAPIDGREVRVGVEWP